MNRLSRWAPAPAIFVVTSIVCTQADAQQALGSYGGDLIVSSTTYTDPGFAANQAGVLPVSGGATTVASSAFCTTSNCSGNVWNNDSADANFGITSQIVLSDVNTTSGHIDNSVNVTQLAANAGVNLATSFSSKSELAINLSTDGSSLTFMGYNSAVGKIDISNSNTPGVPVSGSTDTAPATYRAVGQINLSNNALQTTLTSAYSGDNSRAAIAIGNGRYYTVGNTGSTDVSNTGVQLITSSGTNGALGTSQQVGQFACPTCTSDKPAKDDNFRGATVFNNTLYVSKGSGSNGIDTVYQVGSAGTLPAAGASTPITVLPGLNNTPARNNTSTPHPFGTWFANSTTLYVADEGSGTLATDFSGSTPTQQAGGLDKYTLGSDGQWRLDYELRGTLIGSSYTVNGTGSLAGDSLSTTVDGLRNLTGKVNADGTVTLYAVTSTAGSNLADAGSDPNQIVAITDTLADTTAGQAAGENFNVLDTAALGEVYRGVAVAPVPLPGAAWLFLSGMGGLGAMLRRRRSAA